MSTTAAAIIGAVISFQSSAIIFLAYAISRTRERLARLEQRMDDRNHYDTHATFPRG